MSKHKKPRGGPRKPILPARDKQVRPVAEVSSQALALGAQLSRLTPDQWKERLARNLLGAIALRDEPEFADFHFDEETVIKAMVHHIERYGARLNALVAEGKLDAARELYDDMRIDVIAELVTPEVRRDLQERAGRCLARLKRGQDANKIEMALYVGTLLSGGDETVPLGLCGLFTAIYEDSSRRATELYEVE